MKYLFIYILFLLLLFLTNSSIAQSKTKHIGFYFQPEYSAMFLKDHVGNAVGFNLGIISKNKRWEMGIRYYGRSGPINQHQEFELVLNSGTSYKGKSVLNLGADHGYLGIEMAYIHTFSNRLFFRIPISIGQLGAGFYLKDEDRITPDGRRVSEWENELQGNEDAGFSISSEIGTQLFYQSFKKQENILIGIGLHLNNTYGYKSFIGGDDYFNNTFRFSIGLRLKI